MSKGSVSQSDTVFIPIIKSGETVQPLYIKLVQMYQVSCKSLEISSRKLEIPRNFHAKMGSIKDRNGMNLTKAQILRRGGKNTQKNCTKEIFTTKIIMMV